MNCALGVLNLSDITGNSLGNRSAVGDSINKVSGLAHFCAACKGGFKSTKLNSIFFYIKVECTQIANCSGTEWFNYCS